MAVIGWLVVLATVVVALFVAVNWMALATPVTLSLLVGAVEAPLGFVMLGFVALFALLFAAFALATTIGRRRDRRVLARQRDLADRAEASRLTELRTFLEAQLADLRRESAESDRRVIARLDELERSVRPPATPRLPP
jgi:uncharacterized integral membrane protein